jgi:hypothetical protein
MWQHCSLTISIRLQVAEAVMLSMLDSLPSWTAHLEHQEVWMGPSESSTALRYTLNPFGVKTHYMTRAALNTLDG